MPYVLWNPFGYALSLVTSVLTMPGKENPGGRCRRGGEKGERRRKGIQLSGTGFPISCLLTRSIRIHDAVGISKFS